MELCDINLEQYIYGDEASPSPVPRFIGSAPSAMKASQIWNIMCSIANGLTYIHDYEEIHRDLKPPNGILYLKRANVV
jgi:serine/threonine protein kinase